MKNPVKYFLDVAELTAKNSTCRKRQYGAVAVFGNHIIAAGYNGTPRGFKNCDEDGCGRCGGMPERGKGYELCMCIHAEENVILDAAKRGISLDGATMYVNGWPCLWCLCHMWQVGIQWVVMRTTEEYPYVKDTNYDNLFQRLVQREEEAIHEST